MLDFLDFCVGPLEDVHGRAAHLATAAEVEDAVAMTFRTARGVPGAGSWNFSSQAKEDRLEFFGTKGRVSFVVSMRRLCGSKPNTARGVRDRQPPHVAQPLIQTIVEEFARPRHLPQHRRSPDARNA